MLPLLILVAVGAAVIAMKKPSSGPGPVLSFTREAFHTMFRNKAAGVDWGGIPWKIALAQSDLETGYGNGGVFQRTMNLFSITKGSSWKGPVYRVPSNGLEFRVYPSWEASMSDWVGLMHKSIYSRALAAALAGDYKGFARAVKAAGYDATNPKYAELLAQRYDAITV